MMLSLSGAANHSDNEDVDRRKFEMSKNEFFDEKICQFCCKSFDDGNVCVHKDGEYVCPKCDDIKFKSFTVRNNHYLNQVCVTSVKLYSILIQCNFTYCVIMVS